MKFTAFPVISSIAAAIRGLLLGCLAAVLLSAAAYAQDETVTKSAVSADTPYDIHGNLSVSGSSLTDAFGESFQIRGISTANLSSSPEYISEDTFRTLRDSWHINTIRLSVYPAEDGSYSFLGETDRQACQELLAKDIQAASDLGLYVIIDWHTAADGDPNIVKDTALSFFSEISHRFQNFGNVLYEVCSDPNETAWDSVSSYAVDVIDTIRSNAPNSVIIVGTPNWSQDVDQAAAAPINRSNLLYALHFYAGTHTDALRQKAASAIESGLPLIVSEFAPGDAYGGSEINIEQGDLWLNMLDQYQVGYVLGCLSNQTDSFALLSSDRTSLSDRSYNDLPAEIQWYIERLAGIESESASAQTGEIVSWTLSNGCTADIVEISGWYGDPASCEYTVTLSNPTAADITSWRIRFTWSQEVSLPEFWNCDIGGSGSSRLVIPKNYNMVIPAGSSVSFGFAATGSSVPSLTNVALE